MKRFNFVFGPKITSLLVKLKEKTEMGYTQIIKCAVEDYAKKKGVENE